MSLISTPQQALEAEQAVLGAVFVDNEAMDKIAGMLEPEDFSYVAHELMWKGMKHLHKNNSPIDFITVVHMLQTYKRLEEIGGVSYVSDLTNAVPTAANVEYYVRIVRSRAFRKKAYDAAQKIMQLATGEEFENDEEFFAHVEKVSSTIRPQTSGEMKHIKDLRQEYFEYLNTKGDTIKTGFTNFDDWMGGYDRGWLIIKAGRPSVGKTANVLQTAMGIAEQKVGEVLIWSQEMKSVQLLNRIMSPLTNINSNIIRKKQLTEEDFKTLGETYDDLEELPIHFYDAKNVTIDEVRATARQIKRKHKRLAAIIVDYLQIMDIPRVKGENRDQAIGYVTRTAKHIAREMDCPFILLSQLNREGADEPQMTHLRESGNIEQDADVIEFLWHNSEDKHQQGKVIQYTVAKGRDAGVNQFRLLFKGWIQKFEELPS